MRPTISLHAGEDQVTFGHHASDDFVLMNQPTGLGWGPMNFSTTALAAGGSVLRHRRLAEADVMIPVLVGGGFYSMRDGRRRLERVLSGEVEVRVTHPDGQSRSRFGYYRDGLEGVGEEFLNGEKLALSLLCPDPWWYGVERVREWGLSTVIKPYWTSYPRLPHYPAWVSSSTVLGEFEFTVSGDAPASPVWTVYGPGSDVLIECGNGCGKRLSLEGEITEPVTFDTANEDITSPSMDRGELWDRVSLDSEFFTLPPGTNKVRVSMVGAQGSSRVVLTYREKFKAGH